MSETTIDHWTHMERNSRRWAAALIVTATVFGAAGMWTLCTGDPTGIITLAGVAIQLSARRSFLESARRFRALRELTAAMRADEDDDKRRGQKC